MLNLTHSGSAPPGREHGFSLLELAIVLLIVGLLLGGLIMPLGSRMDQQRIETSRQQLEQIREALTGYALANDALPCPATPASSGQASATATGCTRQHGFVPAATLGLPGSRNEDQLLLDAWGNPLRYSVSNSDADSDGNWDFVRPGEMRNVTLADSRTQPGYLQYRSRIVGHRLRGQYHHRHGKRSGCRAVARQGFCNAGFRRRTGKCRRHPRRRPFRPQLSGCRRRGVCQPYHQYRNRQRLRRSCDMDRTEHAVWPDGQRRAAAMNAPAIK